MLGKDCGLLGFGTQAVKSIFVTPFSYKNENNPIAA